MQRTVAQQLLDDAEESEHAQQLPTSSSFAVGEQVLDTAGMDLQRRFPRVRRDLPRAGRGGAPRVSGGSTEAAGSVT